jgi:hypothetical protein
LLAVETAGEWSGTNGSMFCLHSMLRSNNTQRERLRLARKRALAVEDGDLIAVDIALALWKRSE